MIKDIYEPPSSDLAVQFDRGESLIRARKLTLLAFLTAPIISTSVLVGIALVVDGIAGTDFELAGQVVFDGLLFSYALTLIFGLPFHWILGQFYKRKLYLYLIIGIVIPAPFVLISGSFKSSIAWIIAAVIGATWSLTFWFIAVYLYER